MINWSMALFALMLSASVALSFKMSKVVDNLGLRRSIADACCRARAVLNAYFETCEEFEAFTTFAKSEFIVECVLGWRALVDYRSQVPGHLASIEIYNQFLSPTAPFPLDNTVKGTPLKRHVVALEGSTKSSANPDEGPRWAQYQYFDVLLGAIVDKILHETLPRFQRHALGVGWFKLVVVYSADPNGGLAWPPTHHSNVDDQE
ncbi:hypothetical protein H310_02165 [Aphanomyces invadans]|uniref:RGS domain-containing protein n=1 Tax=Aphanomyces invadans TaxID=157072 RepID=A0A024UPE1_9STRA|nr:hypothetical protein H310_02165 [Aphanomyces invadans]ETW07717.1 hypothetical protein H310_02165 [Aphanomyces invadans]|eukprot:XP_008863810.1 hypothetical protein H310_02165 [Aphanomyces invadans]